MEPIMAMAIISGVSAVAQYYQAQKAAGASQQALDRIKDEFDAIAPPDLDLSVTDPPQLITQKINRPDYDMRPLTPEQYKVLQQYKPEMAARVAEQNPELIKETGDMATGRQAQMEALTKLKGAAANDRDPEFMNALAEAQRQARGTAQSTQANVLQDAQRRGSLNSGLGLMAQLQGSANASNQASISGQNAAALAYKNRMAALRDSANLGGNIRDQDERFQGRNVDIINSFNERTSRNAQELARYNTEAANFGQRFNIGQNQSASDANTQQKNQYDRLNRDREDDIMDRNYGRDVSDRDYANDNAKYLTNFAIQQKALKNQMEMDKYGIAKGVASQHADLANSQSILDRQKAQDNNAAISGVTQAGVGYMAQSASAKEKAQAREDALAQRSSDRAWQSEQYQMDRDAFGNPKRRQDFSPYPDYQQPEARRGKYGNIA